MLHLRASSLADTHAIAAALAALSRAGDLIVLAGEMGAGKTAFAKGFGAALGVTEPITSPTFTWVHSYQAGKLTLHHADIYRLSTHNEVADLALADCWSTTASCCGVGRCRGRLAGRPPAGATRRGDDDEGPAHHLGGVGRAWALAGRRGSASGLRMLILGIETATPQVSVAIGGHEGVLGMFEVSRGRRHAETLTPAIEFLCRQADIESPSSAIGRHRRVCSRACVWGWPRQGHCAGAVGADTRSTCSLPLRYTDRTIAAVIDARKGELFYACYRPVPGGVQRVTDPRVSSVDDLVADLMARGQNVVCVGDGALRYREQISAGFHCDFAEQFLSHPSAAPLVQLAHARALREEWVNPWEIQPMYLRAPDAQINWATREAAK
jgi:tRNA threonylcarbamoyladenosine biosynthesis protein TsaB